nr:hypothetical protein CFP56_68441 [Quercus suber]
MMTYDRNFRTCDLGSLKKIGRLSEFWVSRHTVVTIWVEPPLCKLSHRQAYYLFSFERTRATDGCGYGSRPLGGAIADLLLGLLKSLPSATPVLEENKGVAFGLIEDAVSDRLTILDLAVLAEDEGEGFDDGVPVEVVDEDLAVGGVCIGELTHDFNQVRVLAHSLLDQSHEKVLRERL